MTFTRTTIGSGFRIAWNECTVGAKSENHRHMFEMGKEDFMRFRWMVRHQHAELNTGNAVFMIEGMTL